jgi:hypothetical protein
LNLLCHSNTLALGKYSSSYAFFNISLILHKILSLLFFLFVNFRHGKKN